MEDLTGRWPTHLAPTSQSAGNTVADPAGHALAMTAPGSDSVNKLPTSTDNTITIGSDLPAIPVNTPQREWEAAIPFDSIANSDGPEWTRPGSAPAPGWAETP